MQEVQKQRLDFAKNSTVSCDTSHFHIITVCIGFDVQHENAGIGGVCTRKLRWKSCSYAKVQLSVYRSCYRICVDNIPTREALRHCKTCKHRRASAGSKYGRTDWHKSVPFLPVIYIFHFSFVVCFGVALCGAFLLRQVRKPYPNLFSYWRVATASRNCTD